MHCRSVVCGTSEQNVRGAATPENENDRPKRLFQDLGLDLYQTVRGLA